MKHNRRRFLKASGALAATGALQARVGFASILSEPVQTVVQAGRMAYTPATHYRPYVSGVSRTAETNAWLQIDLGASYSIESILLYPFFATGGKPDSGIDFPLRFKVETATEPSFADAKLFVDQARADCPNPNDQIMEYRSTAAFARYVRIAVSKLRPAPDGIGYRFSLAKIDVISHGKDVAQGASVTADTALVNEKDLAQLTRPPRPQGEGIVTDNPGNIIPRSHWKPVPYLVSTPLTGVQLEGGAFKTAMKYNIEYLLSSFSVDEMLRPFRERAGKPVTPGLREPIDFWDTDLPGSSAGRFMMGAGNTLRWMEDGELRRWLDRMVDGIAECRQPNGYIMAYPESMIMISEKGAYTRAWVTHGLLEAGYAGNTKAFDLLRGYYDWYNQTSYLPQLLRGATQGGQGMVANTRMHFSPVGRPEDIEVIMQYFQENYWLKGLAEHDTYIVWQYPYDRPHNYLITDFEAYLDLYLATGDPKYLDAMRGAWDLYHENWEHVGGSIAITENGEFPPKSYRLLSQGGQCETGETCGSVFWALFNQRFHRLHPEDEKYINEIEKSIYNVALANQDRGHGIIYHARLVGQKGELDVPVCVNSCCEGQATRLIGSLPEYIYSLADDGIYVNLFSSSNVQWSQSGVPLKLSQTTEFPFSPDVELHLTSPVAVRSKIWIRVPTWAASEMAVSVNGNVVGAGTPGSYVTLDRMWSNEDTISFTPLMSFKLTRYVGLDKIAGHERYALEYGPILLALVGSASAVLTVPEGKPHSDIVKQIHQDPDKPLHFYVDGHADYRYIPYWKVLNEPFTCYPVVDAA